MVKKILSFALSVLVLNAFGFNAVKAATEQEAQTQRIEKVKEAVRKLGIGPKSKVEVKLVDDRKFKGFIKDIADDHFVVLERRSGADITVAYARVKEIKGQNGITAAKVAIAAGKAVLVVAGVAAVFTILGLILVPKT